MSKKKSKAELKMDRQTEEFLTQYNEGFLDGLASAICIVKEGATSAFFSGHTVDLDASMGCRQLYLELVKKLREVKMLTSNLDAQVKLGEACEKADACPDCVQAKRA